MSTFNEGSRPASRSARWKCDSHAVQLCYHLVIWFLTLNRHLQHIFMFRKCCPIGPALDCTYQKSRLMLSLISKIRISVKSYRLRWSCKCSWGSPCRHKRVCFITQNHQETATSKMSCFWGSLLSSTSDLKCFSLPIMWLGIHAEAFDHRPTQLIYCWWQNTTIFLKLRSIPSQMNLPSL